MPGKHVTQEQVKLYMSYKSEGHLTQACCAAKSGISERTARTIDAGMHHTQRPKRARNYKTRSSKIDEVWSSKLVPMLEENPLLQPVTLLIYLQREYVDDKGIPIYDNSCLRTLQRRVSEWHAIHGCAKEVMIPQKHEPGKQGLSDFTNMNDLGITIGGNKFNHLLYHFRLVYSKWSYAKIIIGGESFQALSEGLQCALEKLGGSPAEHRTDSLSAAYKNRHDETVEDLTTAYHQLCQFYHMTPTRNNKGVSHENGSVESSHGHLKNRMKQELLLRGSSDFDTLADYEIWLSKIVDNSNRRNSKNFAQEKAALQALPKGKTIDYEVLSVKVSTLSMIAVRNMRYSVPSRLIGRTLTVHLHQRTICGYVGNTQVFQLERSYSQKSKSRYVVDYRHVVHSMVKKPKAFRFCQYRDELLPSDDYRKLWKYLEQSESPDVAAKTMLRLLKLAADHDCEQALASEALNVIAAGNKVDPADLEAQFNRCNPSLPKETWQQHSLGNYDLLLNKSGEHYHAIT